MLIKVASEQGKKVAEALIEFAPLVFQLMEETPNPVPTPIPKPNPKIDPTLTDLVAAIKGAQFEFPALKQWCLAQWMLESGKGSSELFRKHCNAGGMKWRKEMEGYATPIPYGAHDGVDTYCHFASLEAWVRGYWRFIERPVYSGWREAAKKGGEEFVKFLKISGYAEDPSYVSKVLALVPEAMKLLGMDLPTPAPNPVPRKGKRILLDPGHSEAEPGARSNNDSAEEEDLSRIQAELIRKELQEAGHVCDIYDPMVDDLRDIGEHAKGYDLFLSLHFNSYDGDQDPGTEVFVLPGADETNRKFATAILNGIVKALGSANRGVKEANWQVIRVADQYCKGPALLIETCFLNPYSMDTAKKRAVAAADAIAEAVIGLLS